MSKYSIAYLDGAFVSADDATILQTHALHYATAVFEGIRVYDGHAFLLEAHVERLLRSARLIGLEPALSEDGYIAILKETIARSGLSNAYLRPVIYQGGPDLGVYAPNNKVSFGVLIWDWPAVFGAEGVSRGIAITTKVPYQRPSPACFPSEAKSSAGYLIGGINRREAAKAGFDDALMLTYDGFVAEASGANIFAVYEGKVVTPKPIGILNGITRQTVIQNLPADFSIDEIDLELSTLLKADEVFLTGTAYEIMPVRQIDDATFVPGPLTARMAEIYRSLTNPVKELVES